MESVTSSVEPSPPSGDGESPRISLDRPIVLIGMPGAGKTAIGRALASELRVPFVDSDHEIEAAADMSVLEMLERYGESYFRDGERRVILRLLDQGPCVVATGDGAWIAAETRAEIAARALSIWLRATPELLWKRISGNPRRPLLHTEAPRERMLALWSERAPIYSEADIIVDSESVSRGAMTLRILAALDSWLRRAAA